MKRILVAEDSATQAEHLRLLLEQAGYAVEVAADGRAGFERVRAAPPDLIISDVVMPRMDGFAFCRAVKSTAGTRHVPFVLLTVRRTPADIIRGLEHGADNFITKPFEDDHLLERVRRIFEHLEERKRGEFEMEVTLRVGGRQMVINTDRQQIVELLLATSEELSEVNDELEESRRQAEEYARRLEGRARLSEEKYRLLMEHASEAVAIGLGSGKILEVNRAAESLLGRDRSEIVGRHFTDLVATAGHDFAPEAFRRLGAEGSVRVDDLPFRRPDGRTVHVELSAAMVELDGEKVFISIGRDVTERKRLEDELRQSQKMQALGQLAGGVAHDFNNLLGVISGYSELLLRELPAEDRRRRRAEQIQKAGERAAALTRQLLAFSRKQELRPTALDLNAVIADIENILRRLIGENIELAVVPGEGLGRVRADLGQIEQVVLNLAVNARDAMPGGGRLILETANEELDEGYARTHAGARAGGYVRLAVTDTGHGMDAPTRARIFEPFFTTKPEGKGTGLGLATVYGIVTQSGGWIDVDTEPSRGATFEIHLPRIEREEGGDAREASRKPAAGGSETILLLEDEPSLCAIIQETLQGAGYTVLESSDPEVALAIARSHPGPIHLVVSDVVLPRMSGREAVERLRADRPGLPVVFMSGYAREAIAAETALEPGSRFLEKPFSTEALLRTVREALEGGKEA